MPADHASESAVFSSSPGRSAPGSGPSVAAVAVRERVAGTRFTDVRWVAETGSTNADAMALARDGAPEGIVLVADHQHSGRGRRGRQWVAPPGSALLVSVLLRPPSAVAGAVTMAVAVALAEAVEQETGCAPGLKWPNDLVVGDRKLAGILAEADWPPGVTASGGWRAPSPSDRLAVVVGAGLNVNWPPQHRPPQQPPQPQGDGAADTRPAGGLTGSGGADRVDDAGPAGGTSGAGGADAPGFEAVVPADVADVATALNHVVGRDVDRVELLAAFLRRLDEHYGRVVADRSAAGLLDRWRRRSATLGRRVRVDLGASDVEGTAVDVTADGHLVVDTVSGERRTLAVGDVVHLRPA